MESDVTTRRKECDARVGQHYRNRRYRLTVRTIGVDIKVYKRGVEDLCVGNLNFKTVVYLGRPYCSFLKKTLKIRYILVQGVSINVFSLTTTLNIRTKLESRYNIAVYKKKRNPLQLLLRSNGVVFFSISQLVVDVHQLPPHAIPLRGADLHGQLRPGAGAYFKCKKNNMTFII